MMVPVTRPILGAQTLKYQIEAVQQCSLVSLTACGITLD
jgi:hypothetical protein